MIITRIFLLIFICAHNALHGPAQAHNTVPAAETTWMTSHAHYFKNDPITPPPLNISAITETVRTQMTDLARTKKIPGFAAAIVYRGNIQTTLCQGVRSLKSKDPITPDTVFTLGSVSKALTGTYVGLLLQNGKMNLNTPLPHYIPHIENTITHAHGTYHHPMTIHHVLTHTTGVPRGGFNALIESDKHHHNSLRDYFLKARARFGLPHNVKSNAGVVSAPGHTFDYHNVGFALMEPVIEKITGQSFEDSLRTDFFQPLGMKTASASLMRITNHPNRASGHQKGKDGFYAKDYRWGYFQIPSAGGINASLLDMCAFLKATLGHAPQVIDTKTLAMIHTPYTHAPDILKRNVRNKKRFAGSFYGLGWRILDYRGHKIVFHTGWVRGFINIVMMIPAYDVGIVVLQNAETSFPWVSAMRFVDAVLGVTGVEWDNAPVRVAAAKISKSKTPRPLRATPVRTQKLTKGKIIKIKNGGGKKRA